MTGVLATFEKLIWALAWFIGLMLLAYFVVGKIQDTGDNPFGRFGRWLNSHLQPQD